MGERRSSRAEEQRQERNENRQSRDRIQPEKWKQGGRKRRFEIYIRKKFEAAECSDRIIFRQTSLSIFLRALLPSLTRSHRYAYVCEAALSEKYPAKFARYESALRFPYNVKALCKSVR